MSFNLDNFGTDSANAKSILGGICYYRYFNQNNDTITTAGYFPVSLGLNIGDRIVVIPSNLNNSDEVYVVSSIVNRVISVSKVNGSMTGQVLEQFANLPVASADNVGRIVQYIGATGDYTHGYVYESKPTTAYAATVEFNPATISGTTATCSGDDFGAFVVEYGSGDITTIIKGTLTYDQAGGLLVFVGKDDTDTTVCTFQVYTEDYEDAGFVFTGTLQDGDVITFTCTITEEITGYAWTQTDVQP